MPGVRDVDDTIASPAPSSATRADLVASFYDLHQRELFTFALRARRDHRAAEDLVHEAFVELIGEIDEGRSAAKRPSLAPSRDRECPRLGGRTGDPG